MNEKSHSDQRDPGLRFQFPYCQVFWGVDVVIQYSIYNFSLFCKKINLETENIWKS